jgi:hypothetical protein
VGKEVLCALVAFSALLAKLASNANLPFLSQANRIERCCQAFMVPPLFGKALRAIPSHGDTSVSPHLDESLTVSTAHADVESPFS